MSMKCSKCGKIIHGIFFTDCLCSECKKESLISEAEQEKRKIKAISNGKLIFDNSQKAELKLTTRCPNCSSEEKTALPPLRTYSIGGGPASIFLVMFPSNILFVRKYKCAKCSYLWAIPRSIPTLLTVIILSSILGLLIISWAFDLASIFKQISDESFKDSNVKDRNASIIYIGLLVSWPFTLFCSVIASAWKAMILHRKPEGDAQNMTNAIEWYRKAADQGNARAQYNLGWCYANSKGMDKAPVEAVKWYRKAAEQGNARGQYNLGLCYEYGKGVTKDMREATEWFRKAAEQGDAKSQHELGSCYYNGEGVAKKPVEAVKWWRKAAEQGDADAQYNLGLCYLKGDGVDKNMKKRENWYRKVACCLGLCHDNEDSANEGQTKAVEWWCESADQGHVKAQYNLGVCYANGFGIAKDQTKAVEWYRKAAEQGNEDAKRELKQLDNCQ